MKNTLQEIPLREILLSKHNPRKIKPKDPAIAELAKSIDESGLLQPVVCRPMAEGFELLAGARRFEAHRLLGRNTILAIVRDLNDQQAIEVTVLENLQRENLTPLEEGRGVKELLDSGKDPKAIASDIGKSVAWVFKRAKLVDLVPEIVKEIEDPERNYWNQLSAAHLELIARLPAERQQKMLGDEPWRLFNPGTVAELSDSLAREEMLIEKAPWLKDTKEAPCADCVKRSDVQPELFLQEGMPILLHKARCLDPDCWKLKNDAWLQKKAEDLRKEHGDKLVITGCRKFRESGSVKCTHAEYDVESCKKSTPGARPAMIVNDGTVKQSWVKVKPGMKELKPKQPSLELRRKAWVINHVIDLLERHSGPFQDLSQAAAFISVFGTQHSMFLANCETWIKANALTCEKAQAIMDAIWKSIKPVLRKRLTFYSVSNCEHQYKEAILQSQFMQTTSEKTLLELAADALPGKAANKKVKK